MWLQENEKRFPKTNNFPKLSNFKILKKKKKLYGIIAKNVDFSTNYEVGTLAIGRVSIWSPYKDFSLRKMLKYVNESRTLIAHNCFSFTFRQSRSFLTLMDVRRPILFFPTQVQVANKSVCFVCMQTLSIVLLSVPVIVHWTSATAPFS